MSAGSGPEGSDPTSAAVSGLSKALTETIRKVNDPVLLTGIAAAILLVILTVLGPDGSRIIAIVLATVIVMAMVVWAWTRRRKGIRHKQRASRHSVIEGSPQDIQAPTAELNVSSDIKATSRGEIRGSGQRIRIGPLKDEDEAGD
jgi:hypothetical protein